MAWQWRRFLAARPSQDGAPNALVDFRTGSDYFCAVAPTTKHDDTGEVCDLKSYSSRAWCRAELFACWARNGLHDMYVCTSRGLEPLSRAMCPVELVDALDVFAGEMSCCRRGHPDAAPCDKELLMLPMLGIYAEIYKNRHGSAAGCVEINVSTLLHIISTQHSVH